MAQHNVEQNHRDWSGWTMKHDLRSNFHRRLALRTRGRTRRPETGDTLVEVLLAVMVMGISSVAILLAFGTSIFGSSEYRGLAATDTALRTAAEEVTNYLQQQPGEWPNCGAVTSLDSALSTLTLPAPYSVTGVTATYWSPSAGVYKTQTDPTQCPPGTATDPSALVTVTITDSTDNKSFNISTVVVDPSAPTTPLAGTAAQLVFIGQPGDGTAGNTLSAPPEVAVEDAGTNGTPQIVTTDLSSVQLTLNPPSGLAGATLSGDCSGAEIGGVVTFSNCSVSEAGSGFTLTAKDTELPTGSQSITSSAFNISASTPAQIAFKTSPTGGTGGTQLSPEPQVQVEDAFGDVVTNDTSSLSLTIEQGTGANGAQLTAGCSTGTESNGIFSFPNTCAVSTVGSGYVLVATDGAMTADSTPFNVTPGPPAGLAFSTQPSANNTTAAPFSTQPVVSIADAGGNTVTSATATPVTISLATGISGLTGGGTLSCGAPGLTVSTNTIKATFAGCKVTLTNALTTGGTFELKATATYNGTQYTVYSQQFQVAGTVDHLLFSTAPGPSTSGVVFSTQPIVEVVDVNNDVITSGAASTANISLKDGGTTQGTVSCPGGNLTVAAVAGVATFSNCEVTLTNTMASPVTSNEGSFGLKAYEPSGSPVGTTYFPVAGPAAQLAFVSSPGNSTSASPFTTQPVVQVEDQAQDLVTNSTATVTLSATPVAGGSVGCPTAGGASVAAVNGVATFSGCAITLSGNSEAFQLKASAVVNLTTLTPGVTQPFNVAGAPTKLVFTTQPSNGTGGTNLATQPQVTVEDANGYVVTADSSTVTLSLNSPGTSSASVSNTCAGTESLGVVTFSGCSVNQVGNGYTFTATDGSLATATSSPFNITIGTAAQLVFTTSPQGGIAGQAFGVQPVVAVEDAGGNLIAAGAAKSIALTITGGAPLTCASNTATTSGGVATFAGCSTTSAGANISLTATTSGFPVAISNSFNVSPGTAAMLAITSSPVSGQASQQANLGPITVQEQDPYGNPVVVLNNSGLQVTLASSSSAGVFSNLGGTPTGPSVTIPYGSSLTTFYYGDTAAGSPTVTASAAGLSLASEQQTIIPGPAALLAPITSAPVSGPASATANLGPITVGELDQFGNAAPAGSGGQLVALTATGTGTFSTTPGGSGTSVTIPAGSTSVPFYFGDQNVGSQTVTASAFGTQVTQSETIGASTPSASVSTVVASPATGVTANPTTSSSTVTITLKDAFGNAVANKAVSLTPGAGSSTVTTLSGTTNGSGVATFAAKDTVAQTVTYTAKDTTDGITLTTTPTVAFVAGPASSLAANSTVVASPTTVSANGTSFATITVTVRDVNNNPEIGDTVTLGAGSGSSLISTVSGTTNSSGQATFTVADNASQAVSYTATDVTDTVTLAQTATVTFTSDPPSAANSTAVAVPTTGVTANGTASSLITVTIKDGTTPTALPIANQTVTLTPQSGSSVVTPVAGTTTNGSGQVQFTVTDTTAQSVTYTAKDTTANVTVTQTPSVTFVVGPASASVSTAVASPTSQTANGTATSTITVTAVDANGNPEVGDSIRLTAGSGSSVITTSPTIANSSGVATFTVKDTVAQSVTYTATDTTDGVTLNQTPSVTFVAGPVSLVTPHSTVSASVGSVLANGQSSSTITVLARDVNNNPEIGDTITLSGGALSSVITPASATTNSSGDATFIVTDNVAQTVTYTAKDTTESNVQLTQTAAVTFTSDPMSVTKSSAVASPTTVTANGTSLSTITVTITDGATPANPIANQVVTLSAGSGSSLITTVSGTTNSSGVATFTVSDTTAQNVTYTARDNTASLNVTAMPTVAFVAGPASPLAANSTVVASPTSVLANGTSLSTITVTSRDANNNPEIGDTITLGAGSGTSLITTVSGTTNSSGVATFTVADNAAEVITYTATDTTDSVILAQTPTVTFTADSASAGNSTATASPTSVTANGTVSVITVTIKDTATPTAFPIANQTVTLTPQSGSSVVTPVAGTTTNGSGQVQFDVTDTTAQSVTYTAKDTTANVTVTATPTVTFVAGTASASTSTVTASSNLVTANGIATSTITVTALDANNNPEVGDSITLTAGSGSSVITTSPTIANASGVATFTVKDATAQNVTYTAKDATDSVTFTPTETIGFVGPTSASVSTVVAVPTTNVTANGITASTITVTALDAHNNPEVGHTITLAAGSGSSLITTVSGTTNSSGQATFTVTDNTGQTVTYTATDVTQSSLILNQKPNVTFTSDPMSAFRSTVSANATTGSDTYTITVTINDGSSSPIANQTVLLTATPNDASITPVSGTTTNSSGQVQFTVTYTSGSKNVTFTARNTTAGINVSPSSASVTFS